MNKNYLIFGLIILMSIGVVLGAGNSYIAGYVLDSHGAPSVGATVTILNVETGANETVISNITGEYYAPVLSNLIQHIFGNATTTSGEYGERLVLMDSGSLARSFNITTASLCVEDWVSSNTVCDGFNYTIQYVDNNSCGTYIGLPVDNSTSVNCASAISRGSGSSSSSSGSVEIVVPQSALPSESPSSTSNPVSVLAVAFSDVANAWNNFISNIKGWWFG